MDIFSAILLGIVQGATEFLPISSTGHLVLVRELLGIDNLHALAFSAVLHLATVVAIVVYFFDDLWMLMQTVMRKLGRLPVNGKDMVVITALAVGAVPAVVLGFMFENYMENTLRSPLIVAGVLIVGSIFFMFAEWHYQNNYHEGEIDVKTGFKIGLFQTLALVPGFSRAGATIAGGMLLGLSRSDATRFAFLLSIPVILGMSAKKFLEFLTSDMAVVWTPLIIGAVAAFVVGLFAIHFMISFMKKNSLWAFIWYRIILAGFIVFVIFFG